MNIIQHYLATPITERLIHSIVALSVALIAGNSAFAATHCVSTASEFRNALYVSAYNGEADDIRLKSGVYYANSAAPFYLTLSELHGIKISGGWVSAQFLSCAFTSGNAMLTVLDGMNSTTVLRIVVFSTHAIVPVTVEGLTVRNGRNNGGGTDGAGLQIGGIAESSQLITVDRVIAENNTGTGFAPAVGLSSDQHFIRFSNSIVRLNQTANAPAIHIHSNNGGSSLHSLTVLFNHSTTLNNAAVEWGGSGVGQMTDSLVWGNTGGTGDLFPSTRIQFSNNRYGTATTAFGQTSFGNFAVAAPQLDSLHRPAAGSPLRDQAWGVGTKDIYGNQRRINVYADIGAAEGLTL